jgi:hypothetical protein
MTLSLFATIHNLHQNLCDSISLSSPKFELLSFPLLSQVQEMLLSSASSKFCNSVSLELYTLESPSSLKFKKCCKISLTYDSATRCHIATHNSLSCLSLPQVQEMLLIWPGSLLTANLPNSWPPNTPHTGSKFPNSHNTHRPHRTTIVVTSHNSVISPAPQKLNCRQPTPKLSLQA